MEMERLELHYPYEETLPLESGLSKAFNHRLSAGEKEWAVWDGDKEAVIKFYKFDRGKLVVEGDRDIVEKIEDVVDEIYSGYLDELRKELRKGARFEVYSESLKTTLVVNGELTDGDEVKIGVSGVLIEDKYPAMNMYDKEKNSIILKNTSYVNKRIRKIHEVPKEFAQWAMLAEKFRMERAQFNILIRQKEHRRAKEVELIISKRGNMPIIETANVYISDKLSWVKPQEAKKLLETIAPDIDIAQIKIYKAIKVPMEKIREPLDKILEPKKRERDCVAILTKYNTIELYKEMIEKEAYELPNMRLIDTDKTTKKSYWTFLEKIPRSDYNKVREYFTFLDTNKGDIEPAFGVSFRGFATTEPEKVCDILYPDWREKGRQRYEEAIEAYKKELRQELEEYVQTYPDWDTDEKVVAVKKSLYRTKKVQRAKMRV